MNRYSWGEETYDVVMKLCASLTSQHILVYPLRQKDLARFRLRRTKVYEEGKIGDLKRKNQQDDYRNLKERRVVIEEE